MLLQIILQIGISLAIKDVRGWQFLTIEAAETLCMICLPPEEQFSEKKIFG